MLESWNAGKFCILKINPGVPVMSDWEIEVLQRLSEGMASKTIARQLHLSEHTVKLHISSIFAFRFRAAPKPFPWASGKG